MLGDKVVYEALESGGEVGAVKIPPIQALVLGASGAENVCTAGAEPGLELRRGPVGDIVVLQLGAGVGAVAHAVKPYHQGVAAAAAGGLVVFIVKGVAVYRGANAALKPLVQIQITLGLGPAPGVESAAKAEGEAGKQQGHGQNQCQNRGFCDVAFHAYIYP